MRKHHKKLITDIVVNLQETSKKIQKAYFDKDTQTLNVLLADCFDISEQICDFITQLDGEIGTVKVLKDYTDIIYKIKNDADSGYELIKQLKKQISAVENSVKNDIEINKLEIVFFPYKASMWDSMESVYTAAKDDPQCEAYVIPIPYYDKNPDGSLGQMYYEGSEYPDYVPVTDWQNYSVEERLPDVIVVHNPYDGSNYVTSVHTDFYSSRLKNFTDMLMYIPYFVGDVEERFCVSPGVLHADKVIVQSEEIREKYVKGFKEFEKNNNCTGKYGKTDKFIALGSPKFDAVINKKREDFTLPEAWNKLVEKPDGTRKKVVLYNTSLGAMLNGNEQYLEKLRYVLSEFQRNENAVLWWRPHPLIKSTYSSMRPQLYDDYIEIVGEYKKQGYGIYDDTADLHRAIALSDAYYGDWSSLVPLYKSTGKPVFLQNINITDNYYKIEDGIVFSDFKIKDDTVWGVSSFSNGLFSMDLKTKILKYHEIPTERNNGISLYDTLSISGDYIILIPFIEDFILKYNINNNTFLSVPLEDKRAYKFFDSYEYNGNVYAVPYFYPMLIKYNTETDEIKKIKEICSDLNKSDEDLFYFNRGNAVDGNSFMLASSCNNSVVKYNMETDNYTIYNVGSSENKYSDIIFDGTDYWLFPFKGSIIKWNEKSGITEETDDFPEGFNNDVPYRFICSVIFKEFIFTFPWDSNMVLKINIKTKKIESFINTGERNKHSALIQGYNKYYQSERYGDYIYASSLYENCLQKINPVTGEAENIPLILSNEDCKKIMDSLLINILKLEFESYIIPLWIFLYKICNKEVNIVSHEVNKKTIPVDINDGSCGETVSCGLQIYKHIKSKILKM